MLLAGWVPLRPFKTLIIIRLGTEKDAGPSLDNTYKGHIGENVKCLSVLTAPFTTAETQVKEAESPLQLTLPEPCKGGARVREMRATRRNPTGVTVKSMPVLEKIESMRPETASKRRKIHIFYHFPKQSYKQWKRVRELY